MSTRTQLLAKLHITLKECGAEPHKEAIYASYGVASARDLSDGQLLELIGRLGQGQCKIYKPQVSPEEIVRKKRSEILSLLTKSPQSANPRYRGLGVPNDWAILNSFIERHAGKLLFNLNLTELDQLRKQLLAMRSKNWYYGKQKIQEGGDNTTLARQEVAARGYRPAERVDLADYEPIAARPPKESYVPSINISLTPLPKGQLLS